MHRQIIYVDQNPLDVDQLNQSKNTMIALGMAMRAILGTATLFDGLACTPTGPASLQVLVGPGSVYAIENVDGTAYGSLASDTTHQIVKQGINLGTLTLSCPAPGTTGQSINYLIQSAYQDADTGATVLPYFNSSDPDVAYNGPGNTGVSQNTVREGQCLVAVKTGVAATTGTQVTPAPDAGYTGLWVVVVAHGQTTITSGNISVAPSAPFISEKLTDKVSIPTGDARWMPIGGGTGRTRLIANTTFHAATGGNDSTGNGTSGTPWLTMQHAYDYLKANYDLAGFVATIIWGGGTNSASVAMQGPLVGQNGYSGLIIDGGNGTFNVSTNCFYVDEGAAFTIQNITLQGGAASLVAAYGGVINIGSGVTFAATSGNHVYASPGNGQIIFAANYTISGGASSHLYAQGAGANIYYANPITVTITGTPAWASAFATLVSNASLIFGSALTVSGSSTGVRYSASLNAVINTNGGGASYLPGGSAGSATTGAQYN